jgi:membrane-associated phospholipid phosphatase
MYIKTHAFRHFSWAFLAMLLLSSPLLFKEKEFLSLWLNQNHHPFLDAFFKYSTHLGDGLILIPVFIFALRRNYFLSLVFALSTFVESLLVQVVLKNGFFADVVRPIKYIAQSDLLHRVEGVDIHTLHSFPSGHTQTAFLLATFIVLFCKRSSVAYVLLFLATAVALSRVYILQHFFIDVWVGSIIGYVFLVLTLIILSKYFEVYKNPNRENGPLRFRRQRPY